MSIRYFDTDRAVSALLVAADRADTAEGEALVQKQAYTHALREGINTAFCAGGAALVAEYLTAFGTAYAEHVSEYTDTAEQARDIVRNRLSKPLSRLNGREAFDGVPLSFVVSIKRDNLLDRWSVTVQCGKSGELTQRKARGASGANGAKSTKAPTPKLKSTDPKDLSHVLSMLDSDKRVDAIVQAVRDQLSPEQKRELTSRLAKAFAPTAKRLSTNRADRKAA